MEDLGTAIEHASMAQVFDRINPWTVSRPGIARFMIVDRLVDRELHALIVRGI